MLPQQVITTREMFVSSYLDNKMKQIKRLPRKGTVHQEKNIRKVGYNNLGIVYHHEALGQYNEATQYQDKTRKGDSVGYFG